MEGKKISFGFKKTKNMGKPIEEEKKEFIECLEEKSIKIVGGEVMEEKEPLIIPMKPNTLVTAERLKQIAEEVEKGIQDVDPVEKPDSSNQNKKVENESLDQMAVRELLQDATKEKIIESTNFMISVPVDKLPLHGQVESSLDDYEAVPIQEFGLAMLRGMGWTPGKDQAKYKQPQLRPKGLGLGADKVVKDNQKKNASKNSKDEELSIVKNAYIKITSGKYSGYYGKVISLDEDNGRVMVDISVKKETVSLSEFMMHPVSKAEYDKECRVLNADKYDEYKRGESSKQVDSPKTKEKSSSSQNQNIQERTVDKTKQERDNENGRRHRSSSEERGHRKKRYSSSDDNSISSTETKHKSRKRHSSDSDSSECRRSKKHKRNRDSNSDKKRDIDKKRKGKKKKRDRDRSPNYRKHKSKK